MKFFSALLSLITLASCSDEEPNIWTSDPIILYVSEHIIDKANLNPSGVDIAYFQISRHEIYDPNCNSATIEVDISNTTLKEGVDFTIPIKTVTFAQEEVGTKKLAIEFNATTIVEPQQIALQLHYDCEESPIDSRVRDYGVVKLIPKIE